jgi:hypothetical protein
MPDDAFLTPPLSDATRKERRLLLVMSVVLLIVVQGGVRPARIQTLGIEFAPVHIDTLLKLLLAAHTFVLVAFVIAARADIRRWELEFAAVRESLLKQTSECRLALLDAMKDDSSGVTFNSAVESLTSTLRVFEPHLRSRTLKMLKSRVRQAEVVRSVLMHVTVNAEDATAYATPPSGECAEISAAQAGVWRAKLQKAVFDKYEHLLHIRRGPAGVKRLLYSEYIKETLFRLRYTCMSSRYLESSVKELARIQQLIRPVENNDGFASAIITDIHLLKISLKVPIDIDSTARQHTVVALARPLGGLQAACHDLIEVTLKVDRDVDRSLTRFSRNAFWDASVPTWVGGTTLLVCALNTWLDGLLIA